MIVCTTDGLLQILYYLKSAFIRVHLRLNFLCHKKHKDPRKEIHRRKASNSCRCAEGESSTNGILYCVFSRFSWPFFRDRRQTRNRKKFDHGSHWFTQIKNNFQWLPLSLTTWDQKKSVRYFYPWQSVPSVVPLSSHCAKQYGPLPS